MLFVFQSNRSALTSLLMTLFVFTPVLAEDTEIYVGQNQGVNDVPPNILFVVDTSGSMSSLVTTTQTDYDPAVTYAGCFDPARVYWRTSTGAPSCGTSRWFNLSAFKCQTAIDQFTVSGFSTGRFGRYSTWSNSWRDLSTNNRTNSVECQADSGVHGNDDASSASAPYADNGGPWSGNAADEINWGNRNAYTIMSANYSNWRGSVATTSKQRIEIVKDAIKDLVNSVSNVNIGLMRFDRDSAGGMVTTPVGEIDTVKTDFIHELYRMYPSGGTPLAQSLYEAAMYFKGGRVDYGTSSEDRAYDLTIAETPYAGAFDGSGYYDGPANITYNRNSHPNSITGVNYNSPIDFECQKNFVVFLTDGEPSTGDTLSTTRRNNAGAGACTIQYDSNDGDTAPDMNNCLPRVAEAMATQDQSTLLNGTQTVSTYTIGFATDQVLLEDTAELGNGEYQTADDSAELEEVFSNILVDILSTSATFSSPAVSVNAFNRTSHRSDLYFTLFKPDIGPHWNGNLKRYKLAFDVNGSPEIVDVNDDPAVNPLTGFFADSARSYWTTNQYAPDGKEADLGGIASKLTNDRLVYTNLSSGDLLTDGNNRVHEDNNGYLDLTALGLPATTTAAERTKLLQWARGIDVNDNDDDGSSTDARVIVGDPLHAQPALIQYDGPDSDPEIIAYVATNDGYLHAIDTRMNYGTERYSFIPKELLGNLNTHYQQSASEKKTYGLDGSVVAWVDDKNNNGIIEPSNGDHAYIYFGMRRGGNNIYALDVTDKNNPKRLWVDNAVDGTSETIIGGSADFTELGQTWSRPVLRKIRIRDASNNLVDTYVLVFAGGYDVNQDASSLRSTDTTGRAVYMVDALTGKRVWWASSVAAANVSPNIRLTEMEYSMPADVAAIDANADGLLDVIYAADTGGQIFRFDFPGSELENAMGGRIAELAADTLANSRRFYYPPDVAIIKNRDRTPALALVINSGYRAHPNSLDTEDRIYMIRDHFPIPGVTPSYSTITESDLFDTTDNLINDGTAVQKTAAVAALNGHPGWYVRLEGDGEKGLGTPFIFDNIVFVSAFSPSTGLGDICAPAEGSSDLYVMGLADGQPKMNSSMIITDSSTLSKANRKIDLRQSGIGGDPRLIMQPNNNDTICVGTECMGVTGLGQLKSEYWFEQ